VLIAAILRSQGSQLRFQQLTAQNGSLCAMKIRQSLNQVEGVLIDPDLDLAVVKMLGVGVHAALLLERLKWI
jgi:hypothetical protein